jgi:phage gpG-like protein
MSAKFDADTINVEGLDKMLKALKQKPPIARIGILGDKTLRKREKGEKGVIPTNAEIGAAHEYGAPARGLPQRSFLRVPLTDLLQKKMEQEGALSKADFKEVLKQGTVLPWLKKIAVMAEGIVRGAFDTGGYGKWRAWKHPNERAKNSNANMLLVDTTQLRDSITSEVKGI